MHPIGLPALDAAPGEPTSLAAPFLAPFDVWNLWTLALYVVAVRAVAQITARKALVAVAVFVGLQLALGLAGTLLGNAVSGIGR